MLRVSGQRIDPSPACGGTASSSSIRHCAGGDGGWWVLGAVRDRMGVVMDAIARFHPIVRRWFEGRYASATAAQEQGWPAIARGRHTLISAPTGSGKTLAAFLTCVDGLVRQGLSEGLPDATQVVYVSPLKALSNDIQRNLSEPLAEMTALAEAMGTPLPEIRAAVRTGDTMASGAAGDGPSAAAHPHHHARVAVHPADVGERAEGPGGGAHAHRRRGARGGWGASGGAPEPVGGAAVRAGDGAGDAHRAVGDAAADRGGGAVPGGDGGGVGGGRAELPGRRDGAPSGDGPGSWRRRRSGSWGPSPRTSCGTRRWTASPLWGTSTARRWSSSTRAGWWSGSHTSCRSGWARRRSPRTTGACRVGRASPSSSG